MIDSYYRIYRIFIIRTYRRCLCDDVDDFARNQYKAPDVGRIRNVTHDSRNLQDLVAKFILPDVDRDLDGTPRLAVHLDGKVDHFHGHKRGIGFRPVLAAKVAAAEAARFPELLGNVWSERSQ